ncbi:unnamed protein product [Calypogeia fissa]
MGVREKNFRKRPAEDREDTPDNDEDKMSFKALGVLQISRLSCVSRRGIHGVETRDGLGSNSEFHTAARQEGRYLCALEDFGLEAFDEGIGEGIEDERRWQQVETVGTDAGEVEKETCELEIWVVNLYHFVGIEDPHDKVGRHTSVLEVRQLIPNDSLLAPHLDCL